MQQKFPPPMKLYVNLFKELEKYNAKFNCVDVFFESEEDALAFILRWS